MKILLDTTYFLPIIGVSIENLPDDIIIRILSKGYEVYMSEITLFELSAKAAKYVIANKLPITRVMKGFKVLMFDNRIHRVPLSHLKIISLALELRRLLPDYIDALIVSSALLFTNLLLTEDNDILTLNTHFEFKRIVDRLNKGFMIKSYREIK